MYDKDVHFLEIYITVLCLLRFSDIQYKAMIGMKIIPSVFLNNIRDMETSKIVEEFDFFKDDLPLPETFPSELLQWRVSKSL